MGSLTYLDASAIVKLVIDEAETRALRDALRERPRRVSSAIAQVEVGLAAARREPGAPPGRIQTIFAGITLLAVEQSVLEAAAALNSHGLRALDAIHLATARSLGEDLDCLIAYDERLLRAAEAVGLAGERPR